MRGHNQFHDTLEAMSRAQTSQWDVADALLREVGPFDPLRTDIAVFREIAETAEGMGFDYAPKYLQRLRDLAVAFPVERRHPGLSFTVHNEAHTPEMLDQAVKLAASEGRNVTHRFIRHMKDAVARAEAHAAAKVEYLGAHRPKEEPQPTAMELTIGSLDLVTVMREALVMSEQHLKRVEGVDLNDIQSAFIDPALADALAVAENYRKIADRLRGHASAGGRKHLNVV